MTYRDDDQMNVKVGDRPSEINYINRDDDPTAAEPQPSKWPPLEQDWPTKPGEVPGEIIVTPATGEAPQPPYRRPNLLSNDPANETLLRREAIAKEATDLGTQALEIWRRAVAVIGVIEPEVADSLEDVTSRMVFAVEDFKRTH